ncbi:MAG: transposase [Verrucomicrobia bacterium]|nr:transposase [Verrucomicrobiota bacterium]
MARRLRLLIEGGIYHVTCRGNRRQEIFRDDADRRRLLERLAESAETFGVRIYLYCLMSNHVHLLVETPRGNLGRFMGSVLTGYTVYFNHRHRQVGHLFQGRYGAQVAEGDAYLLRLSRYIHLNPVQIASWARRGKDESRTYLRTYRWSSYAGYAGLRKAEEWLDRATILELVPHPKAVKAEIAYRRYVEAGLAQTDEEFRGLMVGRPLAVGSSDFCAEMQRRYERIMSGPRRAEDASFRRVGSKASLAEVRAGVCKALDCDEALLQRRKEGGAARGLWAWALQKHAGLTQREIAGLLGLTTGAAVSALLIRHRAQDNAARWQRFVDLLFEG